MKKLIFFVLLGVLLKAQTITFKGCTNLFENQNFIFNKTGTDGTGRGIYITTPVDGNQACGGLGTCEFKIIWNASQNRWEFLADEGAGTFTSPNLIYSNTSASSPFPPSLTLGVWTENTSITTGACGGNLSSGNATLTGDVQNTVLSTSELLNSEVLIFPNPVKDFLQIKGNLKIKNVELFNYLGQKMLSYELVDGKIDLSKLGKGFYLLKMNTEKGIKTIKIIKE